MDISTDWSHVSLHTILSTCALIFLSAIILTFIVSKDKSDPTCPEPPIIPPSIPFIGHVINIIFRGSGYFLELKAKYHHAFYTLPVLGLKYYTVASSEWALAAQKQYRTISFNGIVIGAMTNICVLDADSMKIVKEDMYREKGEDGFLPAQHALTARALAQGSPELDEVERAMTAALATWMNGVAVHRPDTQRLFSWVRREASLIIMEAFYGPRNPFARQHQLEDDFRTLSAGTLALMAMPWPAITARKVFLARKRLLLAFEGFVEQERHHQASRFVQDKIQFSLDRGFSTQMAGRSELSFAFAGIANLVPGAFWLLSWVFADANLLVDIREEVDRCVTTSTENAREKIIDMARLKAACPLLTSTFRETLRIVAGLNHNRVIAEDTLLTNQTTSETYLLKKGNLLQVLTSVIHFESSVWGNDADQFKPRRFIHTTNRNNTKEDAHTAKGVDPAAPFRDANGHSHSGAFRSLGGGHDICLGRHFAQTVGIATAAIFVAGFELERSEERPYSAPSLPEIKTPLGGMLMPESDDEVIVRRRTGFEDAIWAFTT